MTIRAGQIIHEEAILASLPAIESQLAIESLRGNASPKLRAMHLVPRGMAKVSTSAHRVSATEPAMVGSHLRLN
jgi:hypothetical protein